jgi:hypothetical protein
MQEALGGEGVLPFHPDDTIKRIIRLYCGRRERGTLLLAQSS